MQLRSLSCTHEATFALTVEGDVYHWGAAWAKAPHATAPGNVDCARPQRVPELSDVAQLACTPPGYYHARAAGQGYSCSAVTRRGELYTWGLNGLLQLLHDEQKVLRPRKVTELRRRLRLPSPPSPPPPRAAPDPPVYLAAPGLGYFVLALRLPADTPLPAGAAAPLAAEEREASAADASVPAVFSVGRYCFEAPRAAAELAELRGVALRQLAAGAFHTLALSTRGELFSFGHPHGPDHSNGNLLGSGPLTAEGGGGALPPRRVALPVGAAVAEVSVSTYSNLAITVDGRVFTWGDADGNALGHANAQCHAPHWLTSLRGARMAHGALSYTNAAAATDDGRVYTWGGNCWQGGIAAGRNATGPTEVAWGGVPSCYRCASVALGHQHGFLIFEKRP